MTMKLFYLPLPSKICLLLLVGNIFTACPQDKEEYDTSTIKFNLGTYRLQPLQGENSTVLQDFAPLYRLVSQQEVGYLLSSDTGLSLVVDGAGKIMPLDKSNIAVNEHTRVFAATDNDVWLVTETRLSHSQNKQQGIRIIGDKVRVLWFSKHQIVLWGRYQRADGAVTSGLQLYGLDPTDRVKRTTSINVEKFGEEDQTFFGADKFIAGGVSGQDFWLWTREGGLRVLRKEGNKHYVIKKGTVISFPRIDKVVKDIGFSLTNITKNSIDPPAHVYAIAAGEGNRGALYIATQAP